MRTMKQVAVLCSHFTDCKVHFPVITKNSSSVVWYYMLGPLMIQSASVLF